MHSITATSLLLALLSIQGVLPHPHSHEVIHVRRQNWKDPSLYANVDWSKVDYGNGGGAKPVPSPPQPPSQPAPQPAKYDPPQQQQQQQPAPVRVELKNSAPKTDNNNNNKPAPSTGGGSGGSGYSGPKRGLAFNHASPSLSLFSSAGSLLSGWCYNWNSAPDTTLPSSISYVPMLHSLIPVHTSTWSQRANSAIDANSKAGRGTWLMAFNEPDIPSQANLDVGAAVAGYRQYFGPLQGKGGVKLGSPAVSNGESASKPMGLAYLSSFLGACGGCQVDFVPVHWYGCDDGCPVANDIDAFKKFVTKAVAAAKGKPVWVTEFQRKGANEEEFVKSVVPWLEGQGGVERYAYFMVQEGSLVQGGKPSGVGMAYANA